MGWTGTLIKFNLVYFFNKKTEELWKDEVELYKKAKSAYYESTHSDLESYAQLVKEINDTKTVKVNFNLYIICQNFLRYVSNPAIYWIRSIHFEGSLDDDFLRLVIPALLKCVSKEASDVWEKFLDTKKINPARFEIKKDDSNIMRDFLL